MNFFWIFRPTKFSHKLNCSKAEILKILHSKVDLMDGNILFPHYVFSYRNRSFSGFLNNDGQFKLVHNPVRYQNSWRPIIIGEISDDKVQPQHSNFSFKITINIFSRIFTILWLFLFLAAALLNFFSNILTGSCQLLAGLIIYGILTAFYSVSETKSLDAINKICSPYIQQENAD